MMLYSSTQKVGFFWSLNHSGLLVGKTYKGLVRRTVWENPKRFVQPSMILLVWKTPEVLPRQLYEKIHKIFISKPLELSVQLK